MQTSIIGVWKVIAVNYISNTGETVIDPALPGLFIFSTDYYSMTWMPREDLQVDYVDIWHPTDSEKVVSYNSIVTNSGSYEFNGSELTTHVEVAKTPAFVGGTAIYSCEISQDRVQLEVKDNIAHDGTRDEAYLNFRTIITLKRVE